jgi:hypothetical protein
VEPKGVWCASGESGSGLPSRVRQLARMNRASLYDRRCAVARPHPATANLIHELAERNVEERNVEEPPRARFLDGREAGYATLTTEAREQTFALSRTAAACFARKREGEPHPRLMAPRALHTLSSSGRRRLRSRRRRGPSASLGSAAPALAPGRLAGLRSELEAHAASELPLA